MNITIPPPATETLHTNRREFLKTSGKAMVGAAVASAIARPGYAAEDNTLRIALVGCGGRGTGAAANALATKSGPIKLVAMADLFEDRLSRSYDALASAASRSQGSADSWVMGFEAAQVDVPPDRRFLGFDAYQKAMDCLRPGDIVILTTPVAFRWVHFAYAIAKGLNVFMEKPISVDGPTTRRMIQLGEEAVTEEPQGGRRIDVPPLPGPSGALRPDQERPDRRHHHPAQLSAGWPGWVPRAGSRVT